MKKVTVAILMVYKKTLSPVLVLLFGNACVYELSCSEYAAKAFNKYGIIKGAGMSVKRLLSCNAYFKSSSLESI